MKTRFHTTLDDETLKAIEELISILDVRYANDVIKISVMEKRGKCNEMDKARTK